VSRNVLGRNGQRRPDIVTRYDLSQMAHLNECAQPNCQGRYRNRYGRTIAAAATHLRHSRCVVRVGTSRRPQAATPRLPTLPIHITATGRIESCSPATEPTPGLATKLLVQHRPSRLPNALCPLPFPHGLPPPHSSSSFRAAVPERTALQRLRRADDGRTARRAPLVRRCGRYGIGHFLAGTRFCTVQHSSNVVAAQSGVSRACESDHLRC
jgi:hypothetical protein